VRALMEVILALVKRSPDFRIAKLKSVH